MRKQRLPNPNPLPTPRMLAKAMTKAGCEVRDGWCRTHDSSLLIHDGGRVACAHAWKRVA
jgi:hypothetical protein